MPHRLRSLNPPRSHTAYYLPAWNLARFETLSGCASLKQAIWHDVRCHGAVAALLLLDSGEPKTVNGYHNPDLFGADDEASFQANRFFDGNMLSGFGVCNRPGALTLSRRDNPDQPGTLNAQTMKACEKP